MSAEQGQFSLLSSRRFLPLFVTQFLGALNDNLFFVIWQDINNVKLMGIPELESKNHTLPFAIRIQSEIRACPVEVYISCNISAPGKSNFSLNQESIVVGPPGLLD